jgi:hypothetical protein
MNDREETLEQRIAKLQGSLLERVMKDFDDKFGGLVSTPIDRFERTQRNLLVARRRPPKIAFAMESEP